MLKRYREYINTSDNEEEDNNNDSQNKKFNKALNKEKYQIKNNEKNDSYNKNLNKREDRQKKKKLNLNSFNKDKEEEKVNIKKIIYCELCDKKLENNETYLLHMSSKRHKYKMRELLRKEIKNCGTVKKGLIKEKMIASCRRWRINNARYLLYGFALDKYLNK